MTTYKTISPNDVVAILAERYWKENSASTSLRSLVRGVSAVIAGGQPKATVYLSTPPVQESRERIAKLTGEGIQLAFEYVGAFQFTSVGAKLRRKEGYSGRMAAYVQGADNKYYALTCGHVLQGEPQIDAPCDVVIEGNHHLAKFAVKHVFDFNPDGENFIDGALAELHSSAIAPKNILPDGSVLHPHFAKYSDGTEITHAIAHGKKGKILSSSATILVTVGTSEVRLNEMIIAKSSDGKQFVSQGDSGSLFVKTSDNHPLGMLLAKAKSMTGTGGFAAPSDLAVICPLDRTLDRLKEEPEAVGHYPGPYKLI
jgi:hypothetical protein